MRPRIPLAYAGLLIVALVAVIGFAAFSPGSQNETPEPTGTSATLEAPASARVASAVLALRVADADSRTATTQTATTEAQVDRPTATTIVESFQIEQSTTSEEPSTTGAPTTTETSTTTEAPATTKAPTTTEPRDTTPPEIRITSPDDGDTVTSRVVTFRGTVEKGAAVSSGPYEATVDGSEWHLDLVVAPGANGAVFTAQDAAGNTADARVVVYYEPPTTTTTTSAPPATTTTSAASKWSPLWPADSGGRRNVEAWRPLVEKYWPANLVDCALNVIELESHGDPRAYNSRTGAEGLFQHLSKYWKSRAAAAGFRDANGLYATPYNGEANIAAAWVIAQGSSPWHKPWTVDPFFGACEG